jgi:hypothetical protein
MEHEEIICPNCGDGFRPGGRGLGKRFCSASCRRLFHNRSKGEGAVVAALVKAWVETRHAKQGSAKAKVCREARRELTEIASVLIQRDRDAGRPPAHLYVGSLLEESRYIDRARK